MTLRVLIVDDSAFIRRRVKEILEEDSSFKVVGEAENGVIAVQMAARLKPDVITMDVEMPIMDGISAVKKIISTTPTPILMLSAKTQTGAQSTLDALNAGALDFLPKQLDDIDNDREIAKVILRRRVKVVAQQANRLRTSFRSLQAADSCVRTERRNRSLYRGNEDFEQHPNTQSSGREDIEQVPGKLSDGPGKAATGEFNATRLKTELILIAASTGGPVAIQHVLTHISQRCSAPVLILQHMPGGFTESFAKRLDGLCAIRVKQASQHDELKPGVALVCPGGFQLGIQKTQSRYWVELRQKRVGEIYSPCIDLTFISVAENFSGDILTVVLTGMGADGQQGAKQLKAKGSRIWAQDEASSTIYGMPKAIADAGLADDILSLDQIGRAFERLE